MILFGHLGLTLAITRTVDKAAINRNFIINWSTIDYRIVLLGALLPDIIDKAILFVISDETFRSGRLFAHSFLFVLLSFILGLIVWYGYNKSWILVLAVSSFIHQLLDAMWTKLDTFLWPVFDLIHSQGGNSVQVWLPDISGKVLRVHSNISWADIKKLLSDPYICTAEIVGGLILIYFILMLFCNKQVMCFLKTGRWGRE